MSEGFIKTLETKIDTNKNLKLEEQEILDFIKEEENLQALGKELQNICHQSPDRLGNFWKIIKSICEKILQKGGESIDQIRILMFFKEYAGKQFPEINKQIQTFINRKHLEQEIDQATTEALQNSINNLKELGIDTRIIPNWTLLFQTIKHPQDVPRITLKNLTNFLPLPNTIAPENLPYILANFQEIIAEHLHINPGYLSFIGNNGRATGTSLEQTSKGNQYRKTILHNIESIHRKKNLQEKIAYALKSGDIFELWLKKEISSLKWEAQIQVKISKIFTILDDQQTEILLSFMHNKEKNDSKSFLGGLKEVLFHTYLEKKNAYTTTIEKEQILTPEGIDILTPLLKKYGSKAFESLVENSKIINTFYTEAEKLGFSRAIARNDIINLYSKSQATIQEINKLEEDFTKTKNERNKYFYPTTSYGVSTRTIQDGVDWSITAKKKHELMVTLAEEYTSVLLKDPNNKSKKITAPEVFWGFTLDFSKGNSPQTIVRDSFGEKITDQRDLFVDNLKNDKQAAFGSLCGMVGGCTLAGASVFSGNIWATSAGFTAGLKIGNWLGQEVWNGGEYLYTKRWGSLEGTYNQVDKFWNSFLRGIGSHEFKRDQNGNLIKDHNGKIEQEFIGWDKVAMNLGFDYLSTLATFWLSQKFKGMISQIAQVKGIWQGLKFGFEELVLENFFVDIPMNIVQTGVGTLTGIDTDIKTGQTALGTKEWTPTHTSYQSNSLSDMLSAMKEATEENLSFENLSQTFFSTIIYGGLLEWGGAAINKIKSYLPQNQVINFEHSSKAATLALWELKNFMSQNKLSFNKEGHCINTVSKQPLLPSDIKTKELMKHLQNIEATKKIHLETLEAIQKTHKSMLEDPESKPWLLFKLWLLSSTNTPLNILEKKLTLCEQKIEQAKQKGDQKTVRQLEQLKAEYLKVKAMLSEPSSQINTNQDTGKNEIELPSAYFWWKISKFWLSEAQARENSQWMDALIAELTPENQVSKLAQLRATINAQYQQTTGQSLNLTDAQLFTLIEAHKQYGQLGNLSRQELRKKANVLASSISDHKVRRFLLEAGFSGQELPFKQKYRYKDNNYTLPHQAMDEEKFQRLTERTWWGEIQLNDPDQVLFFLDSMFTQEGEEDTTRFDGNQKICVLCILQQALTQNPDLINYPKIQNIQNKMLKDYKETVSYAKLQIKIDYTLNYQNYFETKNETILNQQFDQIAQFYINHILPDPVIFNQLDDTGKQKILSLIPPVGELMGHPIYPKISETHQEKLDQDWKYAIKEFFRYYPELWDIGTQEDYFNYLKSLPWTKQSPIFYHGTRANHTFDTFLPKKFGNGGIEKLNGTGTYLSAHNNSRTGYRGSVLLSPLGHQLFVLPLISNPVLTSWDSKIDLWNLWFDSKIPISYSPQRIKNIFDNRRFTENNSFQELIKLRGPENIIYNSSNPFETLIDWKNSVDKFVLNDGSWHHILWSEKDITQFKSYMEKRGKFSMKAKINSSIQIVRFRSRNKTCNTINITWEW